MVDYLTLHGWIILARQYRTPYAEIDILARKRDDFCVVEVKQVSEGFQSDRVISDRQIKRLKRACVYLHNFEKCKTSWREELVIRLVVAAVSRNGLVEIIEEI